MVRLLPTPPAPIRQQLHERKYFILLVVLLLLVTLHPLLEGGPVQSTLFSVVVSFMLLSAIYVLNTRKLYRAIGFGIAVCEIASIWWHLFTGSLISEMFEFSFFILFHTFVVLSIYRDIFSSERITYEELRGVVCLYILISAGWSAVFYLLELSLPGSFVVVFPQYSGTELHWYDLLYFSFITLGSLGYGDIIPVHPLARGFTIIESMMGIFFVAIIVSKLVSQFIHHSDKWPGLLEGDGLEERPR